MYSLNYLVLSNGKKEIKYVYGPGPGNTNDARLFRLSAMISYCEFLAEKNYYILGDAAFPNISGMFVPFTGVNSSDTHRIEFNKQLSSVRQTVENTFGLFKSKFKRFDDRIEGLKIENIQQFVISAMVFHNLIIKYQ